MFQTDSFSSKTITERIKNSHFCVYIFKLQYKVSAFVSPNNNTKGYPKIFLYLYLKLQSDLKNIDQGKVTFFRLFSFLPFFSVLNVCYLVSN